MNRAILREALSDTNVRAFLRVIREGESSQAASAYRMRYGGAGSAPKFFDDLSRHPKIFERTPDGLMSSAAGAYQATWTSWVETATRWGLTDFSEQSQDEFAVARLIFREALEDVKAGRFEEACRKCKTEWTSLPGGAEANAATKRARETWERWREILADAPPIEPDPLATEHYGDTVTESVINPVPSADEQEARMALPIIPLLAAFGPELVKLIPQFASMFGSGSTVQVRNAKAAEMAVAAVVEAVKAPNLQAAIETMQADPQAAKAAQIAAADVLALVEVGGGIVEARKSASSADQIPPWKNPAVWFMAAFIPLIYGTAYLVLTGEHFSQDAKMMVVTAIFTGLLAAGTAFFLGSSLGSQRKTNMLANKE